VGNSEQAIVIEKVRHFLEFETPSFLRLKMEVTILNRGNTASKYTHSLPDIKSGLHILDSDGNFLEFSGNEKCDQNLNEIVIYFPRDKYLHQNDHRTITFEYVQKWELSKLRLIKIFFTLFEGAHTYIFIKQCEEYDFKVGVFEYVESEESTIGESLIGGYEEGVSFFDLDVELMNNSSSLLVAFWHKMPNSLFNWYYIGLYFSAALVILIPFTYHFDSSRSELCIVVASSCISLLVIIKGWLFQKNMDRRLKIVDTVYSCVVAFLIIEVLYLIDDIIIFSAKNTRLSQLLFSHFLLLIGYLLICGASLVSFIFNVLHKLFIQP